MDLEELRAFLAVVETGSFLTAATTLHLSRATLRRRVDALEARAGVPLLTRTRTGAVTTSAGAALAARGRLIIQEASALVHSIREIGPQPAGLLRVMLPVGLPPHVLTPLFVMVRQRYPQLSFRARLSDDPVGGLLDDVDLVVHFGAQSPQGPWISRELLRVRVWLIGSADYLARHGTPRTIDELREHTLLAWEMPGEDGRIWPTLAGGTFTVAPVLRTSDIHMLRQCAIAGQGIALVPDAMLPDPGVAPEALVPVLPDVVGREVPIRVVVPAAMSEIPRLKVLLDLLSPFIRDL